MNPPEKDLKKLQSISKQWRETIDDLEEQVDAIEGKAHIATIELLDHMKQQQIIVDQYLNLAQEQGDAAWRKNAGELLHMLKDIDATYRRALVYFD